MARTSNIITKRCTKTGRVFKGTRDEIAADFYRDKSQKDGFSPWCKDAERAYNRAYRAGLKKAKADKKGNIADNDVKGRRAFEREMRPERVTRTKKAKATTPAKKVTRTRTTRAKSAKKA